MNGSKFEFTFLYLIDLHNLKKMGRLGLEVHPHFVPEKVTHTKPIIEKPEESTQNMEEKLVEDPVDTISKALEEISIDILKCETCKKDFKSKSGLTRHINQKHAVVDTAAKCDHSCLKCGKGFSDKYTLKRHSRDSKCKDA